MNKQEILNQLDKLKEVVEEYLEEGGESWRTTKDAVEQSTSLQWYEPKEGDRYFHADEHGGVTVQEWCEELWDKEMAAANQLFRTEGEAGQEARRRKAEIALKKWILTNRGDWEPDWSDKTQYKWFVELYLGTGALTTALVYHCLHHPNWCYMPTKEMAKRCAKEMADEWNVYFGVKG